MKLSDIAMVRANWMEGYGNDPRLEIILKTGCDVAKLSDFRFHQSGELFWAELGGEVSFFHHNRGDHNGFAGSEYVLHMADDWDASQWKDCNRVEHTWMSYSTHLANCHLEGRTLHLKGPWSSGESIVSKLIGPCVGVSIMPGSWRNSVRHPHYYQKNVKRLAKLGRKAYEGLFFSRSLTLDMARQIIDVHAPHLDLYEGDFGWYPMIRGGDPKNPRKGLKRLGSPYMSDEQAHICSI